MSQELLNALNESLAAFESAGMLDDVKAIKKKIAAVEKSMEPPKTKKDEEK